MSLNLGCHGELTFQGQVASDYWCQLALITLCLVGWHRLLNTCLLVDALPIFIHYTKSHTLLTISSLPLYNTKSHTLLTIPSLPLYNTKSHPLLTNPCLPFYNTKSHPLLTNPCLLFYNTKSHPLLTNPCLPLLQH